MGSRIKEPIQLRFTAANEWESHLFPAAKNGNRSSTSTQFPSRGQDGNRLTTLQRVVIHIQGMASASGIESRALAPVLIVFQSLVMWQRSHCLPKLPPWTSSALWQATQAIGSFASSTGLLWQS